ncbi:hypothetical protein [Gordonia polyisoprenivorans]|uniref:hypothetical protein n=1 Tax=Gordonia polyisoprenivorans TaxID=84595 RepID=UPI000B99D671|nr:hypothetical protein [Gordonia polyisoprenivorans]OZC32923.1 hypothetical protein CJJ17_16595 [Gordonia polyisoprenivorans]
MSDRLSTTFRYGRVTLSRRGDLILILTVSLLLTLLFMYWSYEVKIKCVGPPFFPDGRSHKWPVGDPHAIIPCYSDLAYLWVGRDINNHVFPYIHGGIGANGQLFGGSVEYPVLSGILMWLGAIGAHTDVDFFRHSAALLAPFGVVITAMLAVLTRWNVLWWAMTPPLILYAFHNWELPVVATAVGAVAVMAWGASIKPSTGERRMSLRTSAILASILLAIGFCLKLYPGFFVLPLAIYVLTGGLRGRRALDWIGAAWVAITAALTVVVIQLPFMVLGYDGWRAALTFQGKRRADVDTNSIWYWGLRHLTGGQDGTYNSIVGVLSPTLIVCAFVVAVYFGWRQYNRTGLYPWIGVSAAMLAGFMVFHKVHSPQYTLWILPFFVLLRVRWPVIVAYLLADFILDTTIFRLFGIYVSGEPMKWWVMAGVNVGVWVHAVLLVYLIGAFVSAGLREPLASIGRHPDLTDAASSEPDDAPPGQRVPAGA